MKVRISIPTEVKKGEVFEIKTLVSHPMESGFRRNNVGGLIPRNIIKIFRCEYRGRTVFESEFGPGTAANPFLSFYLRAVGTGEVRFLWIDQFGKRTEQSKLLKVVDG